MPLVKFQGEMEITPACYSHLTSSLMGLAQGKLAVILEVYFRWLICNSNQTLIINFVFILGRVLFEIFGWRSCPNLENFAGWSLPSDCKSRRALSKVKLLFLHIIHLNSFLCIFLFQYSRKYFERHLCTSSYVEMSSVPGPFRCFKIG